MGKYTIRGSGKLDAKIDSDLRRISEAASPHARAGVLLGGYGRGEGTPFVNPDGLQSPFNDYDLVVVVDRLDGAVRQKFQSLEKQLTTELGLPVDLCPYLHSHLRKCEFSMLNYEMKHGHKVVWGGDGILGSMPAYPHDAIPLAEGTRLLLNRGKLLLDIQQRLALPEPLNDEERIRFIKFINKAWLAFGDCALLVERKYDILYAIKKERIPTIGSCPGSDAVVAGYLQAVELKEWGNFQPLEDFDIAAGYETVRELFVHFLPWYRMQVPAFRHTAPSWIRERLCTALLELLQGQPGMPSKLFYKLQRRFS